MMLIIKENLQEKSFKMLGVAACDRQVAHGGDVAVLVISFSYQNRDKPYFRQSGPRNPFLESLERFLRPKRIEKS